MRNDETRHKLLATQDLTLHSAVKLCRAEEAASQTSSSMPMTGTVNVARKTNYQRQKSHQPTQTPTNTRQEKCPNCHRSKHTTSPCPAAKVVRNGCEVVGRFQSMCRRTGKVTKTGKIGHLKLPLAQYLNSATVGIGTKLCTEVQPTSMRWIHDTGSDIDDIGICQLANIGGFTENLDTDPDDVRTASGDSLKSVGRIIVTLTAGSACHNSTIHVYEGLDDAPLSRQSLSPLGFIPPDWPKQVARMTVPTSRDPSTAELDKIRADLLTEYADVFDDTIPKPMSGPPDIVLEPDAKPHRVYRARRFRMRTVNK